MIVGGYSVLDSLCKLRPCLHLGTWQHRGATGCGGSRNTGAETKCCMTRQAHGCPDPLPPPATAQWARVEWAPDEHASPDDKKQPWPVNEGEVPLDWDDAKVRAELSRRAGFGWPYRIARVELSLRHNTALTGAPRDGSDKSEA